MPLNPDVSSALQLLEFIQSTVKESDDVKLQAQTNDDLNLLISMLENPIFRGVVQIQDSLCELNSQIQQHPSILPVDFDVKTSGELILNLPPPIFETDDFISPPNPPEVDDQRVPVAKLSQSSSSGEPNSPPTISVASMNETSLPPITTMTYALEFQKAVDESSEGRDVITVKLYKPEGCSLGFSVVGLRSEEKGELGIFIQEIQPNGIAGRDGRLHEGDQILAIDGQPLDSNISHPEAISILQKARGLVELIVARSEDVHPPSASPSPSPSAISETSKAGSDMVLNTEWAQVEVIDLVNDGSGLGFGIIGGRSTGVVVKTILPTGVADRDGRLQSGDHILQIGEVNLRGMGSEQVAAVLRQSGSEVRLVVARPVEPTSPDYQALGSHAPIVPTKILGDPEELDRHLIQNGYPQVTYSTTTPSIEPYDNPFIFHEDTDLELMDRQDPRMVVDIVPVTSLPLPFLTMDMLPLDTQLPEMERFTVELKKDVHGLGITIAGYVCEKEELSGIFVKSISAGSAADLCKKIQVNDRIVEVDGKSLQGYTNHDAVEVLRSTGGTVRLSLERYLRGPKFEQLQQAIANSELNKPPTPSSPSALSLPRFPVNADGESTEVEVEGESVTTVDSACLVEANNPDVDLNDLDDVDLLIDTDYEGPLKPTVEAAIKAKWSKIMGPDVDIVVGQLTKFGEGGGLGISLEGTVDVEDGQEVRPHHYIRSILAEGPVGQNGTLKSGDELLEVNGHRLLGMNHIEVVTILKELPRAVRMVCARRAGDGNALRLIDTSQDRAAFAARSLLGGSLQNLLPAMERLVKAKSDGSLASTTTGATEPSLSKLRSRSLEPITGLAMWSSEPHIIELVKGERGLGFSILDYQDPMNPSETVIVIRSLVPGGVAQMDGRLIPGDRLLSVNSVALDNASLDQAVQALKGAPKGVVRIAVAKPLPIPDSVSNSQEGDTGASHDTPTLDDHSMYSCSGSSPSIVDEIPRDDPTGAESSTTKRSEDNVDQRRLSVPLPASLETEIIINKGNNNLGVLLERVNDGTNGMVVTEVVRGGALDGHILSGDLITAINNESLRGIDESQVKTILARAQSLTTDISLRFIKKKLANDYLSTCPQRSDLRKTPSSPRSPRVANELLSEIHSKFRSPIISPLGCESASDKESEYVDCDCIDDRTGASSSPVRVPVTLVRKLSASSYDIDNRCSQPVDSEVKPQVPELEPPVTAQTIDKSPLSASDELFNFVKQVDRTQVKNYILPIRERSLESLNCRRSVNESGELTKGVSEPVLSSRTRKSAGERKGREMTVTTNYSGNVLVAKHWGPQRSVQISRDPKSSLGISIVGGKVDLYNSGPESSTAISGIFIKNILPNSPAGRTGELKAGDRILEVDGIDLRQASHDYAVDVIRSAKNPVVFLVQSLVKWSTSGGSISACSSVKDISCDELKTQSLSEIDLLSSSTEESSGEKHVSQDNNDDVSDISNKVESLSTADKVPSPLSPVSSASKTPDELSEMTPKKFSLVLPETKVVPSSDDEDEDSDEDDSYRDMEGRIRTAAGFEISRASAGNVRRSKEEAAKDPEKEDYFGYTANKVKKKYSNLGASLVIVEFEKTPNGLGISLAGHKDRTKMAVLICGLNPHGLASKSGALQVGDEILEVNGVVLHGRCHLNASAIMKGIEGPVYKIIALRKTDALQELSVKPITQFPLSIEEETPEQRYSSFKGVRTISIRKPDNSDRRHTPESHTNQTGQGLGIMIIEGKHAEVGQGIFISDIQEGSVAYQAGLTVGDMILAVNKDTLLGSNYDTAASLLKKTEGMVTLIVCNPNRAKEDDKKLTEPTISQPTPSPAHSTTKSEKSGKLSQTNTPSNSKLAAPPGSLSPSPSAKFKMDGEDLAPTALVVPGTETCIEITKEKVLGLSVVGGSDTLLGGVVVNEIFPEGAAAKDGRLKPGDQILEFNNEDFRCIANSKAVSLVHQAPAKVRLVVLRGEESEDPLDIIEVELPKKTGKGLGLSVVGRKSGPGILISDIISGGAAHADGRLMKGDQILAVNGEDIRNMSPAEASVILKTTSGKVTLKLGRYKASRPDESTMLDHCSIDLSLCNVVNRRCFLNDLPAYVKFIVGTSLGSLLKLKRKPSSSRVAPLQGEWNL